MRCPVCRAETHVTNTEAFKTGTEVHRIRKCKKDAGHHFQTRETVIISSLVNKGLAPKNDNSSGS